VIREREGDKAKRKETNDKINTAYLEICGNLEERRVRHHCYFDDIFKGEVKCITT
jgi:hypothetical protein